MKRQKRILIAPLHWGLGHASRIIPIAEKIKESGAHVVLAADPELTSFLEAEIAEIEYVELDSWKVSYPEKGSFNRHFISALPSMMRFLRYENNWLQQSIPKLQIDGVISDNRYGMYSPEIPSIFLSHQLSVQSGLFKWLTDCILSNYINRFSECWIPDINGGKLSGSLSRNEKVRIPIHYVGLLSRFTEIEQVEKPSFKCLCIISGPEPHRSRFERKILNQLQSIEGQHLLIRGSSEPLQSRPPKHVKLIDLASKSEIENAVSQSEYIISRMGYSSIMDFMNMKRECLMVPTIGQQEQEYLADLHRENPLFQIQREDELNIQSYLSSSQNSTQKKGELNPPSLLDQPMAEFLAKL